MTETISEIRVYENGQPNGILPRIVIAVCLIIFTVAGFSSMIQESSTWDETHYFGLGKYILQNRRWDVPGSILHPPLSYYLHSIPLLFLHTDREIWKNDPSRVTDLGYLGSVDVGRGQALLSSPLNRNDLLLTLSRLMMLLTGVLLGWFVYSWSYSLYGKWSAMFAIILYSFCPNILAHARLITPDITITTFSLITVYYFWRLLNFNKARDTVIGGICLGLALLSKFSGLLLIPTCLVLMVLWKAQQRPLNVWRCCIFAAIGVAVLLLGYGFNLWPYFEGIVFQQEHAHRGHASFLVGQHSDSGWWYYQTVAFVLKTPIVTMIAVMLALVLLSRKIRTKLWINEAFLLVPIGAVLCFFSVNHQAIGLRYILPIYPFLFVFASSAVSLFLTKNILMGLGGALIGWYLGASYFIYPHYLAYFNELVGGPDSGYEYLVDSNLDWGQDLKGLRRYMEKHAISRIQLSYFGSDSPDRYGIFYDWLPSYVLRNPNPEKDYISLSKGWVAISATNLQGVYFEEKNFYASFRDREPLAKIGYSIFVYKIGD
jgi:4-amino-4-deoxy-L-arabinose transferase-like glycosyltransferase